VTLQLRRDKDIHGELELRRGNAAKECALGTALNASATSALVAPPSWRRQGHIVAGHRELAERNRSQRFDLPVPAVLSFATRV
jgi:hypothetical protein